MSVVHFKTYASAEHAFFGVLPMPNLNDVVVHKIARRRVPGEIFTDTRGRNSNSVVNSGSKASLLSKASTIGMMTCYADE